MSDDLTHRFAPGEEPEVLTADLCEHFGSCEKCPGVSTAGDLGVTSHDRDEAVLCVHECHEAAPKQ